MDFDLEIDGPLLVFGGVNGNVQALSALLEEARLRGVRPSNMLCTGDIAGYGADGPACLDLVRGLGIVCVAGGWERRLVGADAALVGAGDGRVADRLAQAQAKFDDEARRWMAQLPLRRGLLIGGLRLTAIHGALNSIDRYVFPSTPWRVKLNDIEHAGGDGVLAGRSGIPFSQARAGRLWHNSGAIGAPANDGAPHGWFSILTPGRAPRSLEIEHRALAYDAEAAARAIRAAGLPEEHARALLSGRWPDQGVLPAAEAHAAGKPIAPGRMAWRADDLQDGQWPGVTEKIKPQGGKFVDPAVTATGEQRAAVTLERLETLWINTGTLCNLACASCYIESSPRNDRLVYISAGEVAAYLDEIAHDRLGTTTIGFTGGEPFLNPDMATMMEDALSRGFEIIVLTNAMKPMRHFEQRLLALNARYRERMTLRVSLDHYTRELHELERGPRSWRPAIEGLQWLARHDFRIHVAGRGYSGEAEGIVRAGYGRLLAELGVDLNVNDPAELVLFPEMDETKDVPEITTACWGILGKSPAQVMCSNSRMVVKRKADARPVVVACTLLPYDGQFELGATLADARGSVALNHPYCAQFCVLGGAACKR